jgi:ABC-2 type transport system permease protein
VKFREVFRYELEHRLRSPSTWIYGAILLGISFLVIHPQAEDFDAVHVNAPASLVIFAVSIAMFGLLISAAFFGEAAVRDIEVGMDPLLYTSPLVKAEYLGGRFLAALVVNAVVLLAIPLGLAAGTLMPYLDPAAFGPFRAAAFLQSWLLFLLPNVVLVGAILFTVGVLARQSIPVYMAAGGLGLGFLVSMQSLGQVNNPVLAVLTDPLGILSVFELGEHGTAAERNTQLIGYSADLLLNRAVWLAVAMAVLAVLHRRFQFAHPDGGGRLHRDRAVAPDTAPARPVSAPLVTGSFGLRTTMQQTLAIARNSLAEVAANRWFAAVLLAYIGLTVLIGSEDIARNPFDTSTWPVTVAVAEAVLNSPLIPMNFLLIAIYAGELVWKDRAVGLAEIADAAPVSDGVLLLGRFLSLVAIVALLQAAIVIGGILFQAAEGYYHFELDLYLRILFGMNLAGLVLLAALALTIHVVVNHKYLGHIVVVGVCVFPVIAEQSGILRHHLLLYGTDPGWTYSDMNGFGPFLRPFVWFKLYWAAWALLLSVIAGVLWVRGRESGMRRRLSQTRTRLTGPVARTAGFAIALILLLGGFIFYNTNVLNDYRMSEASARQAAYEERYSRFKDAPQPTIETAGLRVEIYPDEHAVDLRGSYRLVNKTTAPIDSVHVYVRPEVETRSIAFDRSARPVLMDEDVGYRIYTLERALNPGESLLLLFDVAFRPRGFPNRGIQTEVVENGAYFGRNRLPFIGYQPLFELSDDDTRERYGLERRPPLPGPDVIAARGHRYEIRNEDKVRVEMIVGTAADQTGITSGVLRRAWTENGRHYFHYAMEAPQSFGAIVFSGRYALHEDRWNDVALSVFHHPDHDKNVDTFVRSMKASLEYFSTQFGPYEASLLRVVEVPRYDRFGRAHGNMLAFTEDNYYMRVKDGEVNALFFGTAHEIAHQWWGGQIKGAFDVRGSQSFLSESLSNYSAMMVTEKAYGAETTWRIYDYQMDRYLTQRARGDVPMLQVHDQPYIYYGKGAVVMYLMRDYIGEAAVHTALRRFIDKHRAGLPPYPTALDVIAELKAVTPDSLHYLLTDLFETVTLWDVSTKRAEVERNSAGQYVVTMDVSAKKMRADSIGNETEVPMNDFVEIGVFAAGEGDERGEQLYLQRHRIVSGQQTIRITVPRAPARAGVDPWRKLIDRDRYDNVVEVKAAGASPVAPQN